MGAEILLAAVYIRVQRGPSVYPYTHGRAYVRYVRAETRAHVLLLARVRGNTGSVHATDLLETVFPAVSPARV